MTLRAEAPAKINRELRVGRRRADGFHEIRSRMVAVDLADRLEAEAADDFRFSCVGGAAPTDDSNLVVRAARALAQHLGIPPRCRLRLEKQIPVGAGLGGGSADAAVTLLLLSRLWGRSPSPQELSRIAAGLGSDVPFFLVGGEADVTGRGERVTARDDAPQCELSLFIPPISVSTRDVYEAYDRLEAGSELPELEVEASHHFFGPNDLARAVLETHPAMMNYWDSAREAALEYTITGSGSTIVLMGVAPEAEEWLKDRHPEATFQRVRTLGREEYRRRTFDSGGSPWRLRR